MVLTAVAHDGVSPAPASQRRYLMCPPTYFDVVYRINAWMDAARPTDAARAMGQWRQVRRAYLSAGHEVVLAEPAEGLPDMVFAANAGLVIDGRVLVARFLYPERAGEAALYLRWFESHGMAEVATASYVNEGEGDFLPVGGLILAGSGFRTDRRAHGEVAEYFARPVVALELVDERFYHLDTALAVLDEANIAYWPAAFSPASRGALAEMFPDALIASGRDALAFGLNACSDGVHVVLPAAATELRAELRARGYSPVPVDTSELQKAGGSVKCCTLELRC